MFFRIAKEVEAKNITDAIKKEKKADIVYIEAVDEENEESKEDKHIGFN